MTSIIKNNAKENIAALQKNLATNESKKISAAMSSEVNEFSGDTNKKKPPTNATKGFMLLRFWYKEICKGKQILS